MKTTGWPVATVLRGQVVMRDGALALAARGEPVRFVETLVPSGPHLDGERHIHVALPAHDPLPARSPHPPTRPATGWR